MIVWKRTPLNLTRNLSGNFINILIFFFMTFTPDGAVLNNLSAIAGISGDIP